MKSSHKSKTAKNTPSRPPAKNSGQPSPAASSWLTFGICVGLALMVWMVYGQACHFGFVNFDDEVYVYDNPQVSHGLTFPDVASAFSAQGIANWVPVTMLSHVLDCQFFGLNAGGHHLTNVLLHVISTILLFLVLRRMTTALWRSAFVAAVFAVHPLGVESVAWISARKDVLSGLFFMLTLWAYAGYVRQPASWDRYLMAWLFAALGLISKPMLVTLPFVLLLLDYWPLKRFTSPPENGQTNGRLNRPSAPVRLVIEKIPFALLSAAACVIAAVTQQQSGAVKSLAAISLPLRVENAFVSYAHYLGKIFWPENLAALYPMPDHWPMPVVFGALILMVALCLGAVVQRKRFPFALTGWFWFAGMLVPVIGLVQVGGQAMADRYVYLPQIGFYLLLTWLVADLSRGWRGRFLMLTSLSLVIIIALAYRAYSQASYWANSETLWTHTLACTSGNATAYGNLGVALYEKRQLDDAINSFHEALKYDPDNAACHDNLGSALLQNGQSDDALAEYRTAVKIDPANPDYHVDLGNAFYDKKQFDEAIAQYQETLKKEPDNVPVQNHLAGAILQLGNDNPAEVLALAQQANKLARGGNQLILRILADADARLGRFADAIAAAQQALALPESRQNPGLAEQVRHEIATYQAESLAHGTNATNPIGGAGTNAP